MSGVSREQAEQSGADHRLQWSANRAPLVDVTGISREKSAQGTWNRSQITDDKNVSHHHGMESLSNAKIKVAFGSK